VAQTVASWATTEELDAVVWTDLKPNFSEKCGRVFSEQNAIAHLSALDSKAKSAAAEYVWRAPSFVQTRLRKAIEIPPWFV
jgi:hypothetical protein